MRASYWAVMVGRGLGVLAVGYGLWQAEYLLVALFLFILIAGHAEYQQTLRREEEERYWAEMARRVNEARAAGLQPPLIAGGPSE